MSILFVELVKPVGGLLWCNDRIGNNPELGLGYLGGFGMGKVKGTIESIGGEVESIALCGSLHWMMIVVWATWSLAPSFFWTR
jgi:hypothetical protein